jgi:RNA polymerase sigma-70 factor (ECF subfamily)
MFLVAALMKQAIQELVALYQNNLFAVAFNVCKNAQDAEDIVQDTFLQYYTMKKEFDSEQHIRAWLIRVAINKAKNANRAFWRCNKLSLEDYMETLTFETQQSENLFETVMKLPEKYRIVIHLFYYEDYAVREIADILKLSESNVKVRLSRGRCLLKKALKEEWDDDK